MPLTALPRPQWLTFDCYGTLIQWDEGLQAAIARILGRSAQSGPLPSPEQFLHVYDGHEHRLERTPPHQRFADITRESLRLTMRELGMAYRPEDADTLIGGISAMPPFPEVVDTLGALKQAGFRLCIISNTDDAIIAGNVRRWAATSTASLRPSRPAPTNLRARSSPTRTPAWASRPTRSCTSAPALISITPPRATSAFAVSGSTGAQAANACLTTVPTLPYPPWIRSSACSAKRAGSDQRFPLTCKGCHEPRLQVH